MVVVAWVVRLDMFDCSKKNWLNSCRAPASGLESPKEQFGKVDEVPLFAILLVVATD
jgi:hypothetical protein